MLSDVVKALFYACSSYPKIGAPHRLSISNDYEICMLSSIVASLGLYDDVYKIILEFKRGERDVKRLEIGKKIAKALSLCIQDIGYKMSLGLCISSPILLYTDFIQMEIDKDFLKALRRVFSIIQASKDEDVVEFVRIARSLGGDIMLLIDKAGITEKRVFAEALSLQNIFEELSNYNLVFKWFSDISGVIDAIRLADKFFNKNKDLNYSLIMLFIELARGIIDIPTDKISEIIKIDAVYRKKGVDLSYLIPCLAYASLYIIKTY